MRPTTDRPVRRPNIAAPIALFLAAVSCGHATLGHRTGPEFHVAVADYDELLSTADPAGLRERLANCVLPTTREHHDRLLGLLRQRDRIDAAHLILLVEAVSLPENSITITTSNAAIWYHPARGVGEFAAVADQLIDEGAPKVTDLDCRWLGELIGRTQSDPTLLRLCERFVPKLDDGSMASLDQMLDGLHGSPAQTPFLVDYMMPQGRLDGARGWRAVDLMPFDGDRLALLAPLVRRQKPAQQQILDFVRKMAFDEGRTQALSLLLGGDAAIDGEAAEKLVGCFAFDDGRIAAIEALAKDADVHLAGADVRRLIGKCAFDSGRQRCLRVLAPMVGGAMTPEDAVAVARCFAFDSDRLEAVRLMAPTWRSLPPPSIDSILAAFAFDSSRTQARELLR